MVQDGAAQALEAEEERSGSPGWLLHPPAQPGTLCNTDIATDTRMLALVDSQQNSMHDSKKHSHKVTR